MHSGKIAVLIGTRPGIIKMSTLVHELEKRSVPNILIHSGQHYSQEMDEAIMADVDLRNPDYYIKRDETWNTHAQQTAYMMTAIEEVLIKEKPDTILVCGDANTNLAGALAARKIHIKVGHVEAGLRSFDWRMPEEHNRVIIDHISEYLFAPTDQSRKHLIDDGVRGDVFVVGNTIVDASLRYAEKARQRQFPFLQEVTDGEPYILLTTHREENVDDPKILSAFLEAMGTISMLYNYLIVFPIHPRTYKRLKEFGLMAKLEIIERLKVIPAQSYLDFLSFLNHATIVMTDSGGVQEESCIQNIPCITLRENTERPETVEVGANHIAGNDSKEIVRVFKEVETSISEGKTWPNPYGDGKTSERIITTVLNGRPVDEFCFVNSTSKNESMAQ